MSRQSLQHGHHLTQIRKWVFCKVTDALVKLRESDPETFPGGPMKPDFIDELAQDKARLARAVEITTADGKQVIPQPPGPP